MRYMTWVKFDVTAHNSADDSGRGNIDVTCGSGIEKMDLYGKTLIERVMSGILQTKIDSLSVSDIEAAIKTSGMRGGPEIVAIKDGWKYTTSSGRTITFTYDYNGPVAVVDFEANGNEASHTFAEQIATYARNARASMGEFYNA